MQLDIRNAAGTAKSLGDVVQLCDSAVTSITVGSVTWLPRPGNIGTTTNFNVKEGAYSNSLGLPNVGIEAFARDLPAMAKMAHHHGKKLVVSVAGFSPREYIGMALRCYEEGADLVECNFGCPNVWSTEGRKPIPSYDTELAREILQNAIPYLRRIDRKVSVKISPVGDTRTLVELADIIVECGVVHEVVACNTIPDQVPLLENGLHALSFKSAGALELNHVGGVSGKPLFKDSLALTRLLRCWLPKDIHILSAGGIFTGQEAQHFLDAGAYGFSCAAAYMVFGRKVFGDIAQQLITL